MLRIRFSSFSMSMMDMQIMSMFYRAWAAEPEGRAL
jgi:hypothetical protein